MGYDLTWLDDPYADERERVAQAITAAAPTTIDAETLARYAQVMYRAMEAVGGYLRTSQALMGSLLAEMDTQGLLDGNDGMREKLEAQAGTITPAEIRRALDTIPTWPREPLPPIVASPVERATLPHAGDARIIGGAEAIMRMPPLAWAQCWLRWLRFLAEAESHGGIVVA